LYFCLGLSSKEDDPTQYGTPEWLVVKSMFEPLPKADSEPAKETRSHGSGITAGDKTQARSKFLLLFKSLKKNQNEKCGYHSNLSLGFIVHKNLVHQG
jgi:hypothetical protein